MKPILGKHYDPLMGGTLTPRRSNAKPGDFVVTERHGLWRTFVDIAAATLWGIGIVVFGCTIWTVVTLIFSLDHVRF